LGFVSFNQPSQKKVQSPSGRILDL